MIKIAICDDEYIYTAKTEKIIKNILYEKGISNYEINIFHSGIELNELKHGISEYHLVFIDIHMDRQNGFDTAKNIRKYDEDIFIVFITAFSDYSLEGYKFDALRFIVKDSLKEMLWECMENFFMKLRLKSSKITMVFIEGRKEIFVDKIYYVESNKHKLYFKLVKSIDKVYSLYGKLDEIESKLKEYDFLRIHKSYLVNMRFIESIERYKVIMLNGERLPVPRVNYKIIKDRFFENRGTCL
ncbi:MAG: LytTR family DNA-binding domain-containing protein [Lachnospiraceae bacterium]|nr:LytTR family DNA-binding domain-containing protein [Lachnospiraceae bacterium]